MEFAFLREKPIRVISCFAHPRYAGISAVESEGELPLDKQHDSA
jgi:hypothetical protein